MVTFKESLFVIIFSYVLISVSAYIDDGNKICFDDIPRCSSNSKYSNFDGSCNNLKKTWLGMPNVQYLRILPTNYRDGISLPRISVTGSELPSPRLISTTIFKDLYDPDPRATLVTMQWGQFLTHDMAITFDATETNCCDNSTARANENICLPIKVPSNDYFYSPFGVRCLDMVRKRNTFVDGCATGRAEQINDQTAYIDGSQIYGFTKEISDDLREFSGGRLKISRNNGRVFLPQSPNGCPFVKNTCFVAGDVRVNQNPQLVILQNIFLRVHNMYAKELSRVNPSWNDDKLYLETRRIIQAILQHITYREYLPIILGDRFMKYTNIYPEDCEFTQYKHWVDPRVSNVFTAMAFRTLHSTIQGKLLLLNDSSSSFIQLSDWLNNPKIIFNNYDAFINGFTYQPQRKLNRFVTTEITNRLFKNSQGVGTDLESIDVQRGRDHGLPTYVETLRFLFNYDVRSFNDLSRIMEDSHINLLKSVYKTVYDVDLYVGSILEREYPGTMCGPTLLTLIGEQFVRTMYGDRYWYTHENQYHSFTPDQLKEIQKITLSRILCDGGDDIQNMPYNVFLPVSNDNRVVSCRYLPRINFSKWKY